MIENKKEFVKKSNGYHNGFNYEKNRMNSHSGNGAVQNQYKNTRPYSKENSQPKFNSYPKTRYKIDETIDDIKADIARIEKEIELEIKEIRMMRQ